MLGFEDEQEVSQFCQHYGFRVSESEVMLDRADYIEPETAWSPRRSINIIESKLLVTVGEVGVTNYTSIKPISPFWLFHHGFVLHMSDCVSVFPSL